MFTKKKKGDKLSPFFFTVRVLKTWNRLTRVAVVLGDIQNVPGHCPGQPAPAAPALSSGTG